MRSRSAQAPSGLGRARLAAVDVREHQPQRCALHDVSHEIAVGWSDRVIGSIVVAIRISFGFIYFVYSSGRQNVGNEALVLRAATYVPSS